MARRRAKHVVVEVYPNWQSRWAGQNLESSQLVSTKGELDEVIRSNPEKAFAFLHMGHRIERSEANKILE